MYKMKNNKIYKGIRKDNGLIVIGELWTWDKYPLVAIITTDEHQRISQGYEVEPFRIELVH